MNKFSPSAILAQTILGTSLGFSPAAKAQYAYVPGPRPLEVVCVGLGDVGPYRGGPLPYGCQVVPVAVYGYGPYGYGYGYGRYGYGRGGYGHGEHGYGREGGYGPQNRGYAAGGHAQPQGHGNVAPHAQAPQQHAQALGGRPAGGAAHGAPHSHR